MLVYNADFEQYNSNLNKEPRWVVAIDYTGSGDWHYFTSHSGTPLPAGATDYTHSVLKVRSLASQTLTPNEGRATIGAIAFDLLDISESITTLMQTWLDAGYGLNKKTVKVYKGYAELTDFDTQFELVATQVVSKSVTFDRASLSWKVACADAQRLMKKDLFQLASTNITATVSETATTISVGSTTGFEMFEHDAGYDDAPSATVGYLKLKRSKDEFELVRYTDKTATSYTGCTRGVLGTKPLEHVYTVGDEADRQIEVEEYVYLEGPIIKIAYAILTGSLYGQAGQSLPSGWHLGIDTAFVATGTFTGIGEDIWDTADPSLGHQCRFQGIEKQDGKKFFEQELMLLAGCFHTVLDDGQIAVRRMANAAPDASTVGTLDASNIKSAVSLENSLADVANIYDIAWNWEDLFGRYTRRNILADTDSVATHQLGDIKGYQFRGMYGNRYTVDRIYQRFDALRSMYAGPPLQMSITTLGTADVYEVGDTVRVQLDNLRDFTNGSQHSLDRAFQVFGKSVNATNGQITYKLFGSSQQASAMPAPSISGLSAVLPDSFYSSGLNANNEIEYLATGGVPDVNKFEVVGGVGILKTNITCTGVADNINHVDSIFWYDGDLEFAAGVTVTLINGAQIRARGFFENKGTITGKGNGLTGTSGTTDPLGASGTAGFIGSTEGGGGIISLFKTGSYRSRVTAGDNAAMPSLAVEYDGASISGIPSDLRGTSGGAGGGIYYAGAQVTTSGDGGNGGAPVVIVSRGFSTLSGNIDTSGNDGGTGDLHSTGLFYAGSGAGGCPGAVIVVTDGPANSFTGISKITTNRGEAPIQGTPLPQQSMDYGTYTTPAYSYFTGAATGAVDAIRQVYVTGEQTPQVDIPQGTSNDTAPTLSELVNTPRSAAGNLSTIEITANDAGDSNYSYSVAYYRVKGTESWTRVDVPASPETTQVVASDGTTYEVHTRSVSAAGKESPGGTIAEITVANVISPTLADTQPESLPDLRIPNVHGLELFGQGNGTVFTGKDAKFIWRSTSATEFYEMGHEPTGLGADAGTLDQYFQDYRVRIYDGTTLLREEAVTDTWYTYTFEKNAEDYKRINGPTYDSSGNEILVAYRSFRIEVVMRVTFTAAVSERAAKLSVSNPAPELPTGVSVSGNFQQIAFKYNPPADLDWTGARIWVGIASGFTRDDTTLVYDGPDTNPTIHRLTDGTELGSSSTYYLRFALYDAFGKTGLNESAEYAVTLPVAITSDDVQSLIADKIAAGELGEAVTLGGIFVAYGTEAVLNGDGPAAGTWRLDIGPVSDGGITYIERFHDAQGNANFGVTTDGDVFANNIIATNGLFSGSVTITGGSGLANLTDANADNISETASKKWAGETGADKASTAIGSGVTVATGAITFTVGGVDVMELDGVNKAFWINNETYGSSGIQAQYNGGSPRAYFGDGNEKYFEINTGTGKIEVGPKVELAGADSFHNNSIYFHSFFESLDGWWKYISGAGSYITILTSIGPTIAVGTGATDYARMSFKKSHARKTAFDWTQKRRFSVVGYFSTSFEQAGSWFIGMGDPENVNYIGFKTVGTSLYAITIANYTSYVSTALMTLTPNTIYEFAFIYDPVLDETEFYVDEVLVFTDSTYPMGAAWNAEDLAYLGVPQSYAQSGSAIGSLSLSEVRALVEP